MSVFVKAEGSRDIFYTYILKCVDGSFYTGYTKDIEKRIREHKEGKGSKYVRSRLPIQEKVYVEEYETQSEAMQREIEIKKMSHEEKSRLWYFGIKVN